MSPRVRTEPFTKDDLRYDPDGPNSFFRDLMLKAESDQRRQASFADPVLRGRDQGPIEAASILTPKDIDVVEKRMALAPHSPASGRQKFDLATGTVTALIPTAQLPKALAEKYEIAARARAAVAAALGTEPIPAGTGMTAAIVALTGGAGVSVQTTENTSTGVGDTDPTFGLVANAITYGTGIVDVSRQLLDRAGNGTAGRLDAVIAAELGRASGTLLDQQILNGSGSAPETRGLLNTTNINSTTFTDAAPTVLKTASKLASNYTDIATNYGVGPDTLILAPRRHAWLQSQTASGEDQPRRVFSLYDQIIEAPAMPITLNTNQDALLSLRTDAVHIFAESEITAHTDPGSGTLTVRFRSLVKVAVVVPIGTATGKVLGTGTTTPTFA